MAVAAVRATEESGSIATNTAAASIALGTELSITKAAAEAMLHNRVLLHGIRETGMVIAKEVTSDGEITEMILEIAVTIMTTGTTFDLLHGRAVEHTLDLPHLLQPEAGLMPEEER